MAKDRKITETDRYWYKLGFMNGESQLTRTVEKLRAAFGHLFDELTRLDRDDPRVGVLLDYKAVDQIITALRKPTKNFPLANKITLKKLRAEKKDAKAVLKGLEQELLK